MPRILGAQNGARALFAELLRQRTGLGPGRAQGRGGGSARRDSSQRTSTSRPEETRTEVSRSYLHEGTGGVEGELTTAYL